jgi:hypothetical protein
MYRRGSSQLRAHVSYADSPYGKLFSLLSPPDVGRVKCVSA